MEPLMTPAELAEMLGVTEKTLRNWRAMAPPQGPAFVKVGKFVRYQRLVVLAWVKKSTIATAAART